jgi:hypothetical protein
MRRKQLTISLAAAALLAAFGPVQGTGVSGDLSVSSDVTTSQQSLDLGSSSTMEQSASSSDLGINVDPNTGDTTLSDATPSLDVDIGANVDIASADADSSSAMSQDETLSQSSITTADASSASSGDTAGSLEEQAL